jgi:hypothetical protein
MHGTLQQQSGPEAMAGVPLLLTAIGNKKDGLGHLKPCRDQFETCKLTNETT